MEADVLWKAAMRPRLPTGLGKRFRVSHISHSPCQRPETEQISSRSRISFADPDQQRDRTLHLLKNPDNLTCSRHIRCRTRFSYRVFSASSRSALHFQRELGFRRMTRSSAASMRRGAAAPWRRPSRGGAAETAGRIRCRRSVVLVHARECSAPPGALRRLHRGGGGRPRPRR